MAQTIFITGASSGIGLASAKLFLAKGWNVVATMRSPEQDTELKQLDPTRILVLRLDLQDHSCLSPAIDTAIAKFGKIDVLLNNAGFAQNGLFETISRQQIQQQFDVNVFGVMDMTRAILPHFHQHNGGGIVNVSSGAGYYGLPMVSVYNASKFALEGFTESLAFELASQNIFVKNVVPHGGVVATNFGNRSTAADGMRPDAAPEPYRRFMERTGQRFWEVFKGMNIRPEAVAGMVYEAATDGKEKLRYPVFGEDTKDIVKARFGSKGDEDEYIRYMRALFG
ncbi:putative NAD(P)H-binding [Lyophyllum shimeji]|uniref:NAD(P)H-binding n=1 Tax=Lyophyllum shimeji TaxID=47721 RepID=A0A9P3UMZ5_LYOSH|nr:putative NAD(P)H-binding [Lyophyllum shimeji]